MTLDETEDKEKKKILTEEEFFGTKKPKIEEPKIKEPKAFSAEEFFGKKEEREFKLEKPRTLSASEFFGIEEKEEEDLPLKIAEGTKEYIESGGYEPMSVVSGRPVKKPIGLPEQPIEDVVDAFAEAQQGVADYITTPKRISGYPLEKEPHVWTTAEAAGRKAVEKFVSSATGRIVKEDWLSPEAWGETPIPKEMQKHIAVQAVGAIGDFAGFFMMPIPVAKGAISLATLGSKAVLGGLGKKMMRHVPAVARRTVQYFHKSPLLLGTASVISDITDVEKAPERFVGGAALGFIFSTAGLTHVTKSPKLNWILSQTFGRAMLATTGQYAPERFTKENIGEFIFSEALNFYFLSKGISPKRMLYGNLSPKEAKFVDEVDKEIYDRNRLRKKYTIPLLGCVKTAAKRAKITLPEVVKNADILESRLVLNDMSVGDLIKGNKHLQEMLHKSTKPVISKPKSEPEEVMPNQHRQLLNQIFGLPLESTIKKKIERKAFRDLLKNPKYVFEEIPVLEKEIDYKIKAAEHRIAVGDYEMKQGIKETKEQLKAERKQAIRDATSSRERERLRKKTKWDSERELAIYATKEQAGGREKLKLMGLSDAEIDAPLTAAQMKRYNTDQRFMEKKFQEINNEREYMGKEPMEKVENYMTFMENLEASKELFGENPLYDPKTTKIDTQTETGVPFRFDIPRKGKGDPISLRYFDTIARYTSAANKFICKATVIEDGRRLIGEHEILIPGTNTVYKYGIQVSHPRLHKVISDYLQYQAGGMTATGIENKMFVRTVSRINRNIGMAVLSYNARSILVQPTALAGSFSILGAKWMIKGLVGSTSPEQRQRAYKKSKVLLGRQFDVHYEELFGGAVERNMSQKSRIKKGLGAAWVGFGKVGMKPLQVFDMWAAEVTWMGAYARAKAPKSKFGLGMSEKDARLEADNLVRKSQASAAPSDIAPLQRTVSGKLVTLFQTFVINQMNFVWRDVLGRGGAIINRPGVPARRRAAVVARYASAVAFINAICEYSGMQSPFPAPEWEVFEMKKDPFSIELKDDLDWWNTSVVVAREMAEQLPVVGGSIRWSTPYRLAAPSIVRVGWDATKLMVKFGSMNPKEWGDAIHLNDWDTLTKILGLPGSGQTMKFVRRIKRGMNPIAAFMGVKMERRKKRKQGW